MTAPLSGEEIDVALAGLPGWSLAGDKIVKSYQFKDFREAMSFLLRLAFEAEALNHHPELYNVYNHVEVRLNTHDAGGKVTAKDIVLAGKIEELT